MHASTAAMGTGNIVEQEWKERMCFQTCLSHRVDGLPVYQQGRAPSVAVTWITIEVRVPLKCSKHKTVSAEWCPYKEYTSSHKSGATIRNDDSSGEC
jgi:hypothetical protein